MADWYGNSREKKVKKAGSFTAVELQKLLVPENFPTVAY
jgi:hypothetical protein